MEFFVIGDQDTVLGLRLAGVNGCVATDRDSALHALRDAVARKDTGVVLVTERVASSMRDEVDAFLFGSGFPLVLEIPDASGPAPGRRTVEDIVRKAIGVNV